MLQGLHRAEHGVLAHSFITLLPTRVALPASAARCVPQPHVSNCSPNPYDFGPLRNWQLVMGAKPALWFWPSMPSEVVVATRGGTDFRRYLGDTFPHAGDAYADVHEDARLRSPEHTAADVIVITDESTDASSDQQNVAAIGIGDSEEESDTAPLVRNDNAAGSSTLDERNGSSAATQWSATAGARSNQVKRHRQAASSASSVP